MSSPKDRVPLAAPVFRGNELAYLKACLATTWVSSAGPMVERFERAVADWLGARHAVAVVNGTSALHLALLVAGVRPEEEVLVPSLSFIAPANAVRYVGAWPVFIDAEPLFWQMDVERVAEMLEQRCRWRRGALFNTRTGRRVRAILPVHVLGHPVDMRPIIELARRYDLVVIEDAAESLGATYRDRKVGTLADIACLSFNGNKVITAAGGGMVVTDRTVWAERARYLAAQAKDHAQDYRHRAVGYNYRLSSLQAALGCAQMEQLQDCVAAKRRVAQAYARAFAAVPGVSGMSEAPWARSVFWLYTIVVKATGPGRGPGVLRDRLAVQRIESRRLWQPLHRSAAHRGSYTPGCPVAERIAVKALSLPSSVGLTAVQQRRVIQAVLEGMRDGE